MNKNVFIFIGKKPNTYTYSKAFAEELVQRECADIPAAIVRPSIGKYNTKLNVQKISLGILLFPYLKNGCHIEILFFICK